MGSSGICGTSIIKKWAWSITWVYVLYNARAWYRKSHDTLVTRAKAEAWFTMLRKGLRYVALRCVVLRCVALRCVALFTIHGATARVM